MKKKILSIVTLLVMLLLVTNNIYAYDPINYEKGKTDHTLTEMIDSSKNFIDIGENAKDRSITENDLKDLSNTIYNILLVLGIVIALVVGLILGIKFIVGGIEQKAEIKGMVIPYIIGCVVVFGAFGIWQIVVNILQSV